MLAVLGVPHMETEKLPGLFFCLSEPFFLIPVAKQSVSGIIHGSHSHFPLHNVYVQVGGGDLNGLIKFGL